MGTVRCQDVTVTLQAGTDRTLYATWTCVANIPKKTPVTTAISKYKYIWQYETNQGTWFNSEWTETPNKVENCTYSAPSNASRVRFKVKAISKYKNSKKKTYYWTDQATEFVYYNFETVPQIPDVSPTAEVENFTLTASCNCYDTNVTHIEFEVVKNNTTALPNTGISELVTNHASHAFNIEAGNQYKVRARGLQKNEDGETLYTGSWSEYTDNYGTIPSVPTGFGEVGSFTVLSSTSLQLTWNAVANAESYTVEYTTKKEYFDTSNETQTSSVNAPSTTMILTGLTTGTKLFFRLKATNSAGDSGWSDIFDIVVGKKPAAPTTWSSTTTVTVGTDVYLYWVHNAQDGSKQTAAQLELTVNGVTTTTEPGNTPGDMSFTIIDGHVIYSRGDNAPATFYIDDGNLYVSTVDISYNDDEEDEEETSTTSQYVLDTSSYTQGTTVTWRVRTKGVLTGDNDWSDWSAQRTVKIYAAPTVEFGENTIPASGDDLEAFPIIAEMISGPANQKAMVFYVAIIANESYTTVDNMGRDIIVNSGDTVFSRSEIPFSNTHTMTIGAGDVRLENEVSYTLRAIVSMDSGLTATATRTFDVLWDSSDVILDAEIGVDTNTLSAYIRPYVTDTSFDEVTGYDMAVYRRETDGTFTEIITGLDCADGITVTDPHPALDEARYRISATNRTTGYVEFYDVPGYPIGEPCIIIQWDQSWRNYNMVEDEEEVDPANPQIKGSMLKLPYNIDVSDKYSPEVTFANYIGREHPVSYYGTQQGHTSSWSTEIPADDKETIYALRRLAIYKGDVYVREPSGTGYWAQVTPSFSIKHLAVTIPITLDIKRVEGGI